MTRILIVDDEANIRNALISLLKHKDQEIFGAVDGIDAQEKLLESPFSLVVCDIRMPRLNGLELLKWAKTEGPDLPFIMISAHGDIKDAVEAMRLGASDYITKPFDPDELGLRIASVLEANRNKRSLDLEQSRVTKLGGPSVERILEKAAATQSIILISGESGTGKEILARRIHTASKVATGPFVPVNLGGIPENLLESELFGYEKGAFTGADRRKEGMIELASGGTLFLDEIGEMPLILQVKLLRVLQDRKVQRLGSTLALPFDARILAATNRDLANEVKAGRFREDLFYRLNVVPIHLPPLRERLDDLESLCAEILKKLANKLGRQAISISPRGLHALTLYKFPGNIRELENILERALIFSDGSPLEAEDFDLGVQSMNVPDETSVIKPLWMMEKQSIQNALTYYEGNQTKAADALGISRRTLFSKIRDYHL